MAELANGRRKVKVITVTGGKGGVGKSSVSLNLAVALCQMGKKVMLFDADLGLANIDVMLGLKVDKNLGHVLNGECELQDILQTGPHGLRIVPASSGLKQMVELTVEQHAGLIRAFSTLKEDIDYFIVDTAAGISDMVLSFCRAAQDVLMVVCNEPTSVADAYAQMKVLSRDYGVRYDMGMFVIRLDWGLGLHLPYETGKNGFYNIHRFKDSHSFHFAVGYPF